MIQKAYKTELSPNNKQRTKFVQHAGCARKAWNWALDRIKEKKSDPNAMQLHRELNKEKKSKFLFMYEVSKCAMQESLRDLQKAFNNFFAKRARFPKFKSRNRGIGSFRLTGAIRVESNKVKLPRLGWINLKEKDYIPTDQHILSATISEKAGRWYVSILVNEGIDFQDNEGVMGIGHHPMSKRLMEFLFHHDWKDYNCYFDWSYGGDGDNGETLMFEMDAFFELLDQEKQNGI